MTHITITIVSETICPWCYIGKRRLDRAIQAFKSSHPDTTFEITWKPFYLNGALDRSASFDKRYYYKLLLGGGLDSPLPQDHHLRGDNDDAAQGHSPNSPSPPPSPSPVKTEAVAVASSSTAGHGAPHEHVPSQEKGRYLKACTLIYTAAEELGIELNVYGRTGWTRDSHKLILLAGLVDADQRRFSSLVRPCGIEMGTPMKNVERPWEDGRGNIGSVRKTTIKARAHLDGIWSGTGDCHGNGNGGNNGSDVTRNGNIQPQARYHTTSSPPSSPSSPVHSISHSSSPPHSPQEPSPSPPSSYFPQSHTQHPNTATDPLINPLQHTLVDRLFTSHFSAGADLSSRSFLLTIAKSLGLLSPFSRPATTSRTKTSLLSPCPSPPAATDTSAEEEQAFLAWLDSAESSALVDGVEAAGRERGVEGIPTFEIQGRFRIGGAQTEGVFLDVFERVRMAEGAS